MRPAIAFRWFAAGASAGMAFLMTFSALAMASRVMGACAIGDWLVAAGLALMNLRLDFPRVRE